MEPLEVFPACPQHFALRLWAGRLYTAGLPRALLASTFGLDIRTIRRVAESLKQVHPDELLEEE